MAQPSNPEFFGELKEWSERKLNLLEKYLAGATKILGSISQVYYVDGFAGRGSYDTPDGTQVPGSPLRAAQLAQSYEQEEKPYSLRCINVEVDATRFSNLQEVTVPYSGLVANLLGPFVDNVDQIVKQVGANPVICFLDPFGVDGIDMMAIRKLIRRQGPTDIWIRFDAREVRRRDGFYNSDAPGAEKNFEILQRAYGVPSPEDLHSQISAGSSGAERQLNALQYYMERLRDEFVRSKKSGYAAPYRIGSLEEELKYYLVFATASPKGIVLASDIVFGIEENFQRELERYREDKRLQQPASQLAFRFPTDSPTPDEIFASKVKALKKVIWESFRGQNVSRLEIHAGLLDDWFGIIKGPHLTKALQELVTDKQILSTSGPKSTPATKFVFRA